MSFLIDPPLLYASGAAYGRGAPEAAQGRLAGAAGTATVATFAAAAVAFYLDRRWTRPISRAFGSRDGRDFMLNSGVLRFDTREARTGTHAAAALLVCTYPLWFRLGWDRGRRARR